MCGSDITLARGPAWPNARIGGCVASPWKIALAPSLRRSLVTAAADKFPSPIDLLQPGLRPSPHRPWPSREWDAWRIYDAFQTETGEVPIKPSDVPVLVRAELRSLKSTAWRSHSPPASSQCQSRAGDEAIRPIICSSQWRAAATFDNTGV